MAHEHTGSNHAREEVVELCLDEFLTELAQDTEDGSVARQPPARSTSVRALRPATGRAPLAEPPPPPSRSAPRSHAARVPSSWAPAPKPASAPTACVLPRMGEVVGAKYEVERVVGHNGHEIVLRARHLDLGLSVVVRCMTRDAALVPGAVNRFRAAAQKALRLHSDQAERVLDFGQLADGTPYRVAALPRGPSLAEVLRVRESLPLVEAVELLLTLCQAVSEAHSLQLVYGNLGPENLFVERRPDHPQRLCFVDFGVVASSLQTDTASVARDFEALPHSRELALPGVCSMAQALPYLAPEQFRSPASVDHRADIWALGTLLFEMVAGRPAFMADSDAELRAKVVAARVPDLATLRPELPEAFASTVMACLQVEPWLRPQSVNDLTSMLVLFSARRPTRSSLPAEAPSCNTEAVAAPITLVGHSSPITVVDERFTSRPQLRAPTVSDRTPTFYSLLLPAGVGTRSWPVARAQQRSHPPSATSPWVVALVAALTLMASVLAAMGTSRWLERPIAPPPLPAPVALVPPSDAVVVDVPSRPAPVPGYNAAAVPSKDVPQRVASRRELQPPGQPAPGRKSARVLFGGID